MSVWLEPTTNLPWLDSQVPVVQTAWTKLLSYTSNDEENGRSEWLLYFVITTGLSLSTYWFFGLLYLYCDYNGWFRAYKVQEDKNSPPDDADMRKLLRVVLRNQVIQIAFTALSFPIAMRMNPVFMRKESPTLLGHVISFAVMVLMYELGFYWLHRLFHYGPLYKHIHKVFSLECSSFLLTLIHFLFARFFCW